MRTWARAEEHEIMTRAAAVSFYAMLACVPFLALMLTAIVQFLPDLTRREDGGHSTKTMTVQELRTTLRDLFPPEAYKVAEDQIVRLQDELKHRPPIGLLLVSLAVTLYLASSLFAAVIDAMNRIYGVEETRSILKIRLTALVMTVIQAAILLGSLIAIVAGPEILAWLRMPSEFQFLARLIQWPVIAIMLLVSFALTFYVGPDADQKWEWITPGSMLGTAGLLIFTLLFRIYVQHFADYNKTYGSLGGVMVLLFWFWVSALLLLVAGQMNKVIEDASPLGKDYGRKTDPTEPPDFKAIDPSPLGKPSH